MGQIDFNLFRFQQPPPRPGPRPTPGLDSLVDTMQWKRGQDFRESEAEAERARKQQEYADTLDEKKLARDRLREQDFKSAAVEASKVWKERGEAGIPMIRVILAPFGKTEKDVPELIKIDEPTMSMQAEDVGPAPDADAGRIAEEESGQAAPYVSRGSAESLPIEPTLSHGMFTGVGTMNGRTVASAPGSSTAEVAAASGLDTNEYQRISQEESAPAASGTGGSLLFSGGTKSGEDWRAKLATDTADYKGRAKAANDTFQSQAAEYERKKKAVGENEAENTRRLAASEGDFSLTLGEDLGGSYKKGEKVSIFDRGDAQQNKEMQARQVIQNAQEMIRVGAIPPHRAMLEMDRAYATAGQIMGGQGNLNTAATEGQHEMRAEENAHLGVEKAREAAAAINRRFGMSLDLRKVTLGLNIAEKASKAAGWDPVKIPQAEDAANRTIAMLRQKGSGTDFVAMAGLVRQLFNGNSSNEELGRTVNSLTGGSLGKLEAYATSIQNGQLTDVMRAEIEKIAMVTLQEAKRIRAKGGAAAGAAIETGPIPDLRGAAPWYAGNITGTHDEVSPDLTGVRVSGSTSASAKARGGGDAKVDDLVKQMMGK